MRRSYLTLAAVCSGWGTIPLVVRRVDLPAVAIVFSRVWIAAAGLAAVIWVRHTRGHDPTGVPLLSHRPGRVAAAAVILAVHWVALFAAYQRAPVGTVLLIVYLAPVVIAVAAPRTLGEHVGTGALAALALGLAGVVLVVRPAVGHASGGGLLLAAFAAATFAALVLVSKELAEEYGGLRLTFLEMTGAGVVLVPVALTADWGSPRAAWGWLAVLGLAHTALGTSMYLAALARVPATHTGILGYLEPAIALLCGWLFLAEVPTASTVAGGLLILAGAVTVLGRARLEVPARVPG